MAKAASRCAFSIEYCFNENQNETRAVDWNFGREKMWSLSVQVGSTHIHWDRDGDLNKEGRGVILERFGLLDWQDEYPLKELQSMSPATLLRERRQKEKTHKSLKRLLITSDSIDHRPAKEYH